MTKKRTMLKMNPGLKIFSWLHRCNIIFFTIGFAFDYWQLRPNKRYGKIKQKCTIKQYISNLMLAQKKFLIV